jgi:hypothetical protein
MALRLKFIGITIPVATIRRLEREDRLGRPVRLDPDLNGMLAAWWDEHLYLSTSMNWYDAEADLRFWEECGLTLLSERGEQKRWQDVCAVESGRGPTFPCDWIAYDPADNSVHLRGTEKGAVIGER